MIEMVSVQKIGSESDETQLVTEGKFSTENGKYVLSYEDSDATGFDGSTTKITIDEDKLASVIRTGTAHSTLIVENGKKHYCYYNTPFGEMMVGIFTKEIKNELTENGGKLCFKYTVDVNASYISDNEIFLNVKNINNTQGD